jgi:sigma-B regulation protein RsbU (phosphoserine phosphatase)
MSGELVPDRNLESRYQQLLSAVTAFRYSVAVVEGQPVSFQFSTGCEATTGYRPQEFSVKPSLWIELIHPDDRHAVSQQLARVLRNEPVPPLEHRIRRKDGVIRWLRDTIVLNRDKAGLLVGYDCLVEDITERKHAEERFRRLLESALDAVVILDGEARIVLANTQAERLFGFSRHHLLGQAVEILIPEQLRDRHVGHRKSFCPSRDYRPMPPRFEFHGLRKDGSEFPAEVSVSPVETEGGVLYSATIRDLSDHERMRQELLKNQAQLAAAKRIQQHLLPSRSPATPGFDIAGACFPAEFVAGDYFDYLQLPDGSLAIVIGDVSGHGFDSALLTASVSGHIRSFAETHSSVEEILTHTNAAMCAEIEVGHFVTLLLARIELPSRMLHFANAGHPSGYVLDQEGGVKATLLSGSLPLAVLPDTKFSVGHPVPLESGDIVVLITDGVLEARSSEGELFGADRTLKVVHDNRNCGASEIIANLHGAVCEFAKQDHLRDDVTAVVIKVSGET